MTERQRQLLIDLIHNHVTVIERIAGGIVKADLKLVPEKLAELDVAATNFLAQLRIQKADE